MLYLRYISICAAGRRKGIFMKNKSANKILIFAIVAIGVVLFILSVAVTVIFAIKMFGGPSVRSSTRIGYVGNDGRSHWSGRYVMLDGTMEKNIRPEKNSLHIEVETTSGTISIEIRDENGVVIFDKKDIASEMFDLNASGKVRVKITAEKHRGSFSIE